MIFNNNYEIEYNDEFRYYMIIVTKDPTWFGKLFGFNKTKKEKYISDWGSFWYELDTFKHVPFFSHKGSQLRNVRRTYESRDEIREFRNRVRKSNKLKVTK